MTKTTVSARRKADKICSEVGCDRRLVSQGLCSKHYKRARKNGLRLKRPRIGNIWDAVEKSDGPDACWPWKRSRLRQKPGFDYGRARYKGRDEGAHRAIWEEVNGPIPDGLWVLHSCDNPPCCNPAHLFLGTPTDNRLDMLTKGRGYKLTPDDVIKIRKLAKTGMRQTLIGIKFHVARNTVSSIVGRKRWGHI